MFFIDTPEACLISSKFGMEFVVKQESKGTKEKTHGRTEEDQDRGQKHLLQYKH